jgi:hypothetical protein
LTEEELLKKFDELEKVMIDYFPEVDHLLIIDLILRQRREKNPAPIYTVEAFLKPGQDIERI